MFERRSPSPEHHAAFRLDGSGASILTARSCARTYLAHSASPLLQGAADDTLVVVSELVTNAVGHAPGPCCLYLVEDRDELTIAVSDENVVIPVPRIPDLSGTGGFGLHILRDLGRRVDVFVRPPRGKTACATVRILTLRAPAPA